MCCIRVQGEFPLGWANLNLFNSRGLLLSGRIDVRIWKSSGLLSGLGTGMGSLDDSVSSSGGAQDRLLKPAGILTPCVSLDRTLELTKLMFTLSL